MNGRHVRTWKRAREIPKKTVISQTLRSTNKSENKCRSRQKREQKSKGMKNRGKSYLLEHEINDILKTLLEKPYLEQLK